MTGNNSDRFENALVPDSFPAELLHEFAPGPRLLHAKTLTRSDGLPYIVGAPLDACRNLNERTAVAIADGSSTLLEPWQAGRRLPLRHDRSEPKGALPETCSKEPPRKRSSTTHPLPMTAYIQHKTKTNAATATCSTLDAVS